MSRKDIEARLDRSLANQVRVPRLDRRFDAAVWARIEAADAPATNLAAELAQSSQIARASRWLAISNAIGVTVVVALLAYFGIKMFGGMSVSVEVPSSVALPAISDAMVEQIVTVLGYVLGFATLAAGISVTPLGRRVRASFS